MDPDAVEMRVLGCLIEKQRTTPDAYPLTLNSLRLACNQSTNRDPVVDYDEREIRGALEPLGKRRWTRLASWGNSRVMKYRHLLDETLELSEAELSVLAVLMLRGAQTPGELRQRTERLYGFEDGELERTLGALADRGMVRELPRRPGERGQRWIQLLGGDGVDDPPAATAYDVPAGTGPPADDLPHDRAGPSIAAAGPEPARAEAAPAPVVPASAAAPSGAGPSAGAEIRPSTSVPPGGRDDLGRRVERVEHELGPMRAEVDGRLEHLESEVAALRRELRELREQLGG